MALFRRGGERLRIDQGTYQVKARRRPDTTCSRELANPAARPLSDADVGRASAAPFYPPTQAGANLRAWVTVGARLVDGVSSGTWLSAFRRRASALNVRLFTVPDGMPSALAICDCVRPNQ